MHSPFPAALAFLVAAFSVSMPFAAAQTTLISACVSTLTGAPRIVSSSKNCFPNLEVFLQWNQQGVVGPAGAQGAPGVAGAAGAKGAAGTAGATGATGAIGATGAVGAAGPAGAKGASGLTGATVAAGPAGASGSTGAIGATGPSGATGAIGATGANGQVGPIGAAGSVGPAGLQGNTGVAGTPGSAGSAGAGAAGPAGPQGPTGAAGPTGVTLPHVVLDPAASDPATNGIALIAAINQIPSPSAGQPWLVQLDAGVYTIPAGSEQFLPSYVSLRGAGAELTTVQVDFNNSQTEILSLPDIYYGAIADVNIGALLLLMSRGFLSLRTINTQAALRLQSSESTVTILNSSIQGIQSAFTPSVNIVGSQIHFIDNSGAGYISCYATYRGANVEGPLNPTVPTPNLASSPFNSPWRRVPLLPWTN